MFYSHEILTSRKYGVATVWLVATLGSKSSLKKINRKAILDVNVPKACETILAPDAPMALRLQSNLLYGVSRVYSQQCVYCLVDAQAAQNNMKALLKVVRHAELDPDAGKARPDQLVLQDDPAFLPDFILPTLDLDFSALGSSTEGSSKRASILSMQSQQSSQSSNKEGEQSLLGLVIPTSEIGNAGDLLGGFTAPESDHDLYQRTTRPRDTLLEDEGFFPDVDFDFDAEGNLIDRAIEPRAPRSESRPNIPRLGSDSAASTRVRQEHEEALQAGRQDMGEDVDLGLALLDIEDGDNANVLPEAEPFPEMAAPNVSQQGFLRSSSTALEREESAEASMKRRPRGPRVIPADMTQELRGSHLAQWNNRYLENMAEASYHKLQHRLPYQAKKNAAAWVFGSGIGDVGAGLGSTKLASPLAIFAGDQLKQALTGLGFSAAGKKRPRTDDEDQTSGSEERRIRRRSDEGSQIGRGDDLALDETGMPLVFDDANTEIGRGPAPLLEDYSSQMPWNISASLARSRQSSLPHVRALPSSAPGFPTSAGGPSSIPRGIPGAFDRRASRLTSASPLLGRGEQRAGSLEVPGPDDDENILGGRSTSDDQTLDDFQLFGPAAAVSTQSAVQTQWLKATLDQESTNFLDFVRAEVMSKRDRADETGEGIRREDEDDLPGDGDDRRNTISFAEILPPAMHSKIVAAQAFHHVLALATKGLVGVRQEVGFGDIWLGVKGE